MIYMIISVCWVCKQIDLHLHRFILYTEMSDLDIEIGKHGLEVEAKGKAIFWIATLSFLAGLVIGGVIGFKVRDKGGKIAKKFK